VVRLDAPDPRKTSYGPEYWLHRCEGFRVEAPEGEMGTVRGLRFEGSLEPELLEVRSGLFGRRVRLIPVERIEEIVADQKLIVLRARKPLADAGLA
jgi:hypothetical protein